MHSLSCLFEGMLLCGSFDIKEPVYLNIVF